MELERSCHENWELLDDKQILNPVQVSLVIAVHYFHIKIDILREIIYN